MQGASPLASPGLNPGGAGAGGAILCQAGGLPRRCRITLPSLSPMGGTAVLVAGFTSHITRFFPHPPRPALAERSSPMGKGEIFGFLMQGASPLASPRLNPGGAGAGGAILRQAGGLPRRCRITLPSLSPMGGTAVLEDRLKMKFRILFDNIQTVSTIYNCKTTSISSNDFSGVNCYRIDILDESIDEINNIVNTVKKGERLEGKEFTNGNLNREI